MKFMGTTTQVSLSTTTAKNSSALSNGTYEVYADNDWFMQQGGSTVTATTTTSRKMYAGQATTIDVSDTSEAYVAGILSAGTSTLYITPVG